METHVSWLEWCESTEFNSMNLDTKNKLRTTIKNFNLPLMVLRLSGCHKVFNTPDGNLIAEGSRFLDGKLAIPTGILKSLNRTPLDFIWENEVFPSTKNDIAVLTKRWFKYWMQTATYLSPTREKSEQKITNDNVQLETAMKDCAIAYGIKLNKERPYFECTIPHLGYEFKCCIPPFNNYPSFVIRGKEA